MYSLFFLITVITSPLFGLLVDATGYNLIWVIVSVVLALSSHIIFMFTFMNTFVPVFILGSSLSLSYASLWPLVSFIVPTAQLSSAYGIMQSLQNLGLVLSGIITGLLVEKHGYLMLELFFVALCLGKTLYPNLICLFLTFIHIRFFYNSWVTELDSIIFYRFSSKYILNIL